MGPRTVIAALLLLACGSEGNEPATRRVGLDEMLGRWTFEVKPKPDCPGGSNIGTIAVTLKDGDIIFRGAAFGPQGSYWTYSGPLVGDVTGLVSLDLPGAMSLHLTVSPPIDSAMTEVAGLQGTVDEDFHFTGKLLDPDDLGFVNQRPIFSSVSCTYSAEGDHSTTASSD